MNLAIFRRTAHFSKKKIKNCELRKSAFVQNRRKADRFRKSKEKQSTILTHFSGEPFRRDTKTWPHRGRSSKVENVKATRAFVAYKTAQSGHPNGEEGPPKHRDTRERRAYTSNAPIRKVDASCGWQECLQIK